MQSCIDCILPLHASIEMLNFPLITVDIFSWDEWTTDLRILKYNEQNLTKQRELLKAQ